MPHVRVLLAIALGLLMALPQQVCICHAHEATVRTDGETQQDCCRHCHAADDSPSDTDHETCICESADRDALPPTTENVLPPLDLAASAMTSESDREQITFWQAYIPEPDPGPPRLFLSHCQFRN